MAANVLFWCIFLITTVAASTHVHNAVETEMFSIPISPNLFNWTYQEFDQQYRFHASLRGKPELPSWLRYIYSGRHHSGFIFGTPPRGTKSPITLEVVGLNRQDYETRRVLLTLVLKPKENMARHEVELKIDNLNVEDLLDEHRMTRLKEILKSRLWVESSQDLYTTFLASAIDLGARLPLRPSDGEGLVVRLGSASGFSSQLQWLREEVRPLARLPACPRDYKRTTAERLFRDAGFTLDWCNFELYNTVYREHTTEHLEYLTEIPNTSKAAHSVKALGARHVVCAQSAGAAVAQLHAAADCYYRCFLSLNIVYNTVYREHTTEHLEYLTEIPNTSKSAHSVKALSTHDTWSAPSRQALPSRSYTRQLTAAVAVPLLLLLLSVAALTAVLCFHYAAIAHKSSKVEICRYGTGNTDQTQVADNTSNKSIGVSPNNSLARPYSPRNLAGDYNRPQPPPYPPSTLHRRSHADTPSTRPHSPEQRHLALEESLKLLNDANILKEPILDFNDGADDYVPIKPDYVSMKNLDDIDVPDLAKVGAMGPI